MSDELRDAIVGVVYEHYGYVAEGLPDAIMHAIAAEAPKPQGDAPPESKRVTAYFLTTEAKRELDGPVEYVTANNLRNALMSVIRAIEVLAK
jgi:hypothetical protein